MAKEQKMQDRIRSEWILLTDEEAANYSLNRQKFYKAVMQKYGLTQQQIDERVGRWETETKHAA